MTEEKAVSLSHEKNLRWLLKAEDLAGIVRTGDKVVQTVRLEGHYSDRVRYLCIVDGGGEGCYCLLGIDDKVQRDDDIPTLGFVARMMWNTEVKLDGDGGFSIIQQSSHFIFKPVSVQALWTVIQTLHMIREQLRPSANPRAKSLDDSNDWVTEYEQKIASTQSCINEWHAMADLLVKRPPSPNRRSTASSKEDAETTIKSKLRCIMKTVDLETITSKVIRRRLEEEMGESLEDYKSFIDQEILLILGQMDPASKILDYLYLGSEWNASNLDELRQNGISHILNVTREIDNFFPAVFEYKNIRVYDEEATDLLKHFDTTYKFIREAKEKGGRVLVHCKMGISRSASVVISFMMKEYELDLAHTLIRAKECRSVVNPNKSFIKQLEVYEGMLGAIRHRLTYYGRISRSKSESSLIQSCSSGSSVGDQRSELIIPSKRNRAKRSQSSRIAESYCKAVDVKALSVAYTNLVTEKHEDRPKSWSPSDKAAKELLKEDCKCFDALSQNCAELMKDPPPAQAPQEALLPPGPSPVNSAQNAYNPDCDCDVEVELRVPVEPVKIHDAVPDQRTDIIVQNLANFPLQMKSSAAPKPKLNAKPPLCKRTSNTSSATSSTSSVSCCSNSSVSRLNALTRRSSAAGDYFYSRSKASVPPTLDRVDRRSDPTMSSSLPSMNCSEDESHCDKRSKNEVLSVKTLANMYDFKTATLPTCNKTCCGKLEDNKLFQKAKNRGQDNEQDIFNNTNALLITTKPHTPLANRESDC